MIQMLDHRITIILLLLFLCSTYTETVLAVPSIPGGESNETGYIIEFEGDPSKMAGEWGYERLKSYESNITEAHNVILKEIKENLNKTINVKREYFRVFDGISIRNVSREDIERIAGLEGIKKIYPIGKLCIQLNESIPSIRADEVWAEKDLSGRNITGQDLTIAIIDTGIDYTHPDFGNCTRTYRLNGTVYSYELESEHPINFTRLNTTWTISKPGASKLSIHFSKIDIGRKGLISLRNSTGSEVKYYTENQEDVWSPAIPGDAVTIEYFSYNSSIVWGFSIDKIIDGSTDMSVAGCKVAGGYNFVSDSSDFIDDNGHGTQCAGIAAGNGSVKGVAPDAGILAYKAIGEDGNGEEDDILAAIDRAIIDGADIISLSLGGNGNPDDAVSTSIDKAVDLGVVVVVSAGNKGPNNGTITSPGCARKALTVGAVYKDNQSANRQSKLSIIANHSRNIESSAFINSNLTSEGGITGELEYAGIGLQGDYAKNNFRSKIALIMRGNISNEVKLMNAYASGAMGAIIYNNVEGNFVGSLTSPSNLPVLSISKNDGEELLSTLSNQSLTVNMSIRPDSNIMSYFSSRGPAYMLNKPDIVAPGVNICSTKAGYIFKYMNTCRDDSHTSSSGTSLAAPHVAGATALLLQKNPGWTPQQVKAALINTAKDIGNPYNAQGAGELDIYSAIMLNSTPATALISDLQGPGLIVKKSQNVNSTIGTYDIINDYYVRDTVNIIGYALGAGKQGYTVEIGEGMYPANWSAKGLTAVGNGGGNVSNGTLSRLNTSHLSNGMHTIRLNVTDDQGSVSRSYAYIKVSNPQPGSCPAWSCSNLSKGINYANISLSWDKYKDYMDCTASCNCQENTSMTFLVTGHIERGYDFLYFNEVNNTGYLDEFSGPYKSPARIRFTSDGSISGANQTDGFKISQILCTNYCIAWTGGYEETYINRVILGSGDKASSGEFYTYETGGILTNITQGQGYALYVNTSYTGILNNSKYAKAWIDYNQDGNFNDSEEIDLGSEIFDGTYVYAKSFIVPVTSSIGRTRMRVIFRENEPPQPCLPFTGGEVEDYEVEILANTSNSTVEQPCILKGDYSPCGQASLREVINLIGLWAKNQATLPEVLSMINLWK
jgi:subtilisin family serine protease